MRSDFSKVVTERPRAGGDRGKRYKKQRPEDRHVWRADDDPAPGGKQGMRRPHMEAGDWKTFTDLLGPLYRFLHSRTGKPWRKVHSEICGQLKGRSTEQQHILDHLKQMVDVNLKFTDGELRHSNGKKYQTYGWGVSHSFYVDPRDGILKKVKDSQRVSWWKDDRKKIMDMEDEVKTKEGQIFRRVAGIWYEITVETWQEWRGTGVAVPEEGIDGTAKCLVTMNRTHKRQLGTAELKKRGLENAET